MSMVTDLRADCGPVLSTSLLSVTSMTFPNSIDLIAVLALDHQRELIEAATERRMVRRAREAHPSRRGWRRPPEPPRAA